MLQYNNQATQVLLVDIPSLVSVRHHPGMGKVASCLRDMMSLATLSTSHLVPSISLTMAQLRKVVQLERWPADLRVVKVLSPAVVLDREEEEESCQHLERHIFTDWLDLDTYFREWLVHHSSEKSDLKVELSHKGVREVLQMDLRGRRVELRDKSRVVENMIDRMTVLSTVSQAGVCQSLLMGEIILCVPTSATLLGWRELEENMEKMITLPGLRTLAVELSTLDAVHGPLSHHLPHLPPGLAGHS